MAIHINRPTYSITTDDRGNHRVQVTHADWVNNYVSTIYTSDLAEAKKNLKVGIKWFTSQFDGIEGGSIKPYNVCDARVKLGKMIATHKLDETSF
jgi:hypothetical protein